MTEAAKHNGNVKLYVIFSVILSVITFCEWLIFEMREEWSLARWTIISTLLFLSLIKFTMVVGWYMHLRFDPTMLKQIFIFALLGMTGLGIGLGFLLI